MAPGAWAASLTPLNDDLSINQGAHAAHIDWLLREGAAVIAALGATGEANSFSVEERLQLIGSLGRVAPKFRAKPGRSVAQPG